jgi:hypothetical protein
MRVLSMRNACLATAIVLAVVLALWGWSRRAETGPSAMTTGLSGEVSESSVSPVVADKLPVPSDARSALPPDPRASLIETRGKGELATAEFEAYSLRVSSGVKMTDEEISQVSDAFAALATERGRIESRIGTFVITGPDSLEIAIPPFPVEGEMLKKKWLAALERILGPERAADLFLESEFRTHGMFSYFGEANVSYTARKLSSRAGTEGGEVRYYVTRECVPTPGFRPIGGGLGDVGGALGYPVELDNLDGGSMTAVGHFLVQSGLEPKP